MTIIKSGLSKRDIIIQRDNCERREKKCVVWVNINQSIIHEEDPRNKRRVCASSRRKWEETSECDILPIGLQILMHIDTEEEKIIRLCFRKPLAWNWSGYLIASSPSRAFPYRSRSRAFGPLHCACQTSMSEGSFCRLLDHLGGRRGVFHREERAVQRWWRQLQTLGLQETYCHSEPIRINVRLLVWSWNNQYNQHEPKSVSP